MKLKLTRTGKRRLEKLCAHLDQRPRRLFDFGVVLKETKCGTVACAIGCTPEVFPRLVEYSHDNSVRSKSGENIGYEGVASELFGMSRDIASELFAPGGQKQVSESLTTMDDHAAPKQVARMLRHFIALTEKGEIEV